MRGMRTFLLCSGCAISCAESVDVWWLGAAVGWLAGAFVDLAADS